MTKKKINFGILSKYLKRELCGGGKGSGGGRRGGDGGGD